VAFQACDTNILDAKTQVDGIVEDETSGQPLDSVVVVLYEDNEGTLSGNHPIQEMKTDQNGKYNFTFEWKEAPYTLKVTRRGYRYIRMVKSTLTGQILQSREIR
jgi:5-hydroxyisourate hydrolase-like protein (transthyretin family)